MAYSPRLSQKHCGTLRRIAWALEMPMTITIEHVIDQIVKVMNGNMVCNACRDNTFCDRCAFNCK